MPTQPSPLPETFSRAVVDLEFEIAAPVAVVWKALTADVNAWWTLHSMKGSRMALDARAGGCLVETAEDGSQVLWYTVAHLAVNRRMTLWGHMSPPWSHPAMTMLMLTLKEEKNGTVLRLQEVVQGLVDPSLAGSLSDGWTGLMRDGLKAHCEKQNA